MSVYNGGATLREAISSILKQSFQYWELILMDDGSNDGAVAALEENLDPRVHVIRDGMNLGLSSRLNQVIALARGKYLARMDHDDIAHPERLAQQVAFLEAHPDTSLLGTRCLSMSEAGGILGQLPFAQTHTEICARPWLGFSLAHPSWMGRTEWFKSHRYADPAPYCCEDQELLLRAYQASRYHALPEALLAYRVRSRTPLMKLFRTRVALAVVQIRYFASVGRYGDCLLAIGAFSIRICADVLRQAAPGIRSDVRALGIDTSREWAAILENVRKQQ
tara:strand:- start:5443 stop:6276 length:834 start_codon:yes stop_codon:yes gene_type:complete